MHTRALPPERRPLVFVALADRGVRRLLAYALGHDSIDVVECDAAEFPRRILRAPDLLEQLDAIVLDSDAPAAAIRPICEAIAAPRPPLLFVGPPCLAEERRWDDGLGAARFVIPKSDLGNLVRRVRDVARMSRDRRDVSVAGARAPAGRPRSIPTPVVASFGD